MIELCLLELRNKNVDIDIICLSETFLKLGHESNCFIKGYELASSFSRNSQKRGGVAIFCKAHIEYKQLSFLTDMATELVLNVVASKYQSINQ